MRLLIVGFACLAVALQSQAAGGNALDRLDFGNTTSEAIHSYSPAGATSGIGALGQTYRIPVPSSRLVFSMGCDPNRQNYLTVKYWGSDAPCGLYLDNSGTQFPSLEQPGGPVIFPNRFYYHTVPLPLSWTQGKTLVQVTLDCDTTTKKIYSAFTHTAPCFVPDPTDATGTVPPRTGQVTLTPLTTNVVAAILQPQRTNVFFGSGSYLATMTNRQIMRGTAGAPVESVGLDLWTTVSTWGGGVKTPDQWRDQIGGGQHGPGYSTFPDELLSVFTTAYLLPPFTNASGSIVAGLDDYHDTNLLYRIVLALDGSTYLQGSDGGFHREGDPDTNGISGSGYWHGLTSTPRAAAHYRAGETSRGLTWYLSLEGVDTQTLGWSIINIMKDPVGFPLFTNYLAQSFDADLNGGSMLRAYAYERMLYNHLGYLQGVTGGTESQDMFEEIGMYACHIALNKIQALYPNASYVSSQTTAMSYVNQTMGVIPDTLRGPNPNPLTIPNYGLSRKGLGEAHGALSTGFDGGGYGEILPWLAPRFALLATLDPNATPTDISNLVDRAHATINSFNQFLSPMDYATVNGSGTITANTYNFSEETFITYRDPKNAQTTANRFNFNAQFPASDPVGVMTNAYALRSAYLDAEYGITPSTGASAGNGAPGGALNYLRDYAAYERTIRSLIGVNPTNLTALPGEPGAPNFAWADVQSGAVAFMNNGERFYLNANWRNYEVNNGFSNLQPSQYGLVHYTTTNIERTAGIYLPYNSANVQPDGNLSSTALLSPYVVRYGNYLVALNNSSNTIYNLNLPVGVGQAQELISKTNFYVLGSTVPIAPGNAAIFWLTASNSVPALPGSPTVVTPASASANIVTNTTVNLNVLGADDGGEANLTYTWGVAGNPPEPVTFSANGNNAAKNTTATFSAAGIYSLAVIIKDAGGLTTNSSVSVTVTQKVSSLAPVPGSVFLLSGQGQQFFAVPTDQFGYPVQGAASFAWAISNGVGSINASGFYTAPSGAGGSAAVQVISGSNSAIANVTVTVPVGFFSGALDIGPSVNGSSSYDYANGTYTVSASGNDIWGTSDAFRYLCQPIAGDSVIIARVATLAGGKAGLMFRQFLDANSAYTDLVLHNNTWAKIEARGSAGGNSSSASISSIPAPYWLKLLRAGDVFTGYASPDGTNWTQVGQMTVAMNDPVYVGLVVCGNNTLRTDTFDHVFVGQLMNFATNGTATTSSQNLPNEGAAKAFDGNTGTKWYNTGTPPPGWLQYNFGAGVQRTMVQYAITSANDVQQRDPKDWQLLGSNDGSTWTALDTRTNQTFASRNLTQSYNTTNTSAYQYYRLNILTNFGGSGYGLQLSELALLGYSIPVVVSPPSMLGATSGDATVNLVWSFSPGAMGYNLKRATVSGGPYTIIASNLTSLAYTNIGLANGTMYYFVVSGLNATGEGGNSAEAAARPISSATTAINASVNAGQIQITWPKDHTGWRLQMQTNSLNTGLGTNWVTMANSTNVNQISIPMDVTYGSVFYRMVYP